MSWEMLAPIGQLAAVLVGIPSLIYLAAQIREQTKERRQATVHALTEQWGDLTESWWRAIERTMTDLISYPGVQQWWDIRKHWHTEEFDQVVREIIARGDTPKAFSRFDLKEIELVETRK